MELGAMTRVKLPDQSNHNQILAWMNRHVSPGHPVMNELFVWAGEGWRYELDPRIPHANDPHVVYFDDSVSDDVITQFMLIWS